MKSGKSRVRRRIPPDLLRRMADLVSDEDRDEMAIPSYLHRNPLLRLMAWLRIDAMAELLRRSMQDSGSEPASRTIMDFGCGTGVLFAEAAEHAAQIYGVDIVLEPARLLLDEWSIKNVSLLSPDDARNTIAPDSLDAIIAAEVLEHIEPLDDTLSFFHSRLAPGGKLLVSVPTENALYRFGRRLAGFSDHYHESNAADIHRNILAHGFRLLELSKIPAPGPFAIYWIVAYAPVKSGRTEP